MKLEFLGTGAADFNLERDQHSEGFRRFSSALLDDKLLLDPGPHIFHYMETYQKPELFEKKYYSSVGMNRYVAAIIDTLNKGESLQELIKPEKRIRETVDNYKRYFKS